MNITCFLQRGTLLATLLLGLAACDHDMPKDDFYLRFHTTAESTYIDMKLDHGILSYTYFDDTQNRCAQWMQSSPCWTEADLKTVKKTLPQQDLDNLYAAVQESGVLKLDDEKPLGDAERGQRHYAQHLDIKLDGAEKHLIYQSFPGASEKPAAFSQIETALAGYAQP